MPNYGYRCGHCSHQAKFFLKLSSDPDELLECPECEAEAMFRIIISGGSFNGLKVFAGDWFKKTYGHDIGDGAARRVKEKEQYEKECAAAEKDGVKFKFKSRQVGGKDRIRVPDKNGD